MNYSFFLFSSRHIFGSRILTASKQKDWNKGENRTEVGRYFQFLVKTVQQYYKKLDMFVLRSITVY